MFSQTKLTQSVKHYKTEIKKNPHHFTITDNKVLNFFLKLHSNNLTDPNLSLIGIKNLSLSPLGHLRHILINKNYAQYKMIMLLRINYRHGI